MPRKFMLIIFCILLIGAFTAHDISAYNYRTNLSMNLNNRNVKMINKNGEVKCGSLSLCDLMKNKFKTTNIANYQSSYTIPSLKEFDSTAMQSRSYYNYGGNTSPAFYPAFDSLSVLASLAFLAFLLQSFASLFDRSRSIIPTIVSSRKSSPPFEPPDPIKLVMRALDEYKIFSNDIILNDDEKRQVKLS